MHKAANIARPTTAATGEPSSPQAVSAELPGLPAARMVDVGVAMSEDNTGGADAEPTPRSLADKVNWLIDWPEQPWSAVAPASRSQRAYPRPEDRAADGHPPGQPLIRLPLRSSRE